MASLRTCTHKRHPGHSGTCLTTASRSFQVVSDPWCPSTSLHPPRTVRRTGVPTHGPTSIPQDPQFAGDVGQLLSMIGQTRAALAAAGMVTMPRPLLADAGYCSQ